MTRSPAFPVALTTKYHHRHHPSTFYPSSDVVLYLLGFPVKGQNMVFGVCACSGLSGGTVIVYPPKDCDFPAEDNVIVGNVCLYGAVSVRSLHPLMSCLHAARMPDRLWLMLRQWITSPRTLCRSANYGGWSRASCS